MNEKEKAEYLIRNGQRVKSRREQLHLTQEQLASLLGYQSKTSINKIEIGRNGIPQSKMRDFAKVLQTDISYLMGDYEIDEPDDMTVMKRQIIKLVEIDTDKDVLKYCLRVLTERICYVY